ncbi:hypothetical protein CROQUDRAFT_136038 [Cronartium quercuum f. sp. fusiforme G11]|uniref:Uncharacterized protein n=1 Tax=Cronartium quercuum f. sp. fusiforme G11 TaxID=708437 RepID=A0A9P6NCE2_9BASI|nr:hypothetical protein CROQUDRAFT_136038 [Cronartium quercuum f. sp. fusiforme G11]
MSPISTTSIPNRLTLNNLPDPRLMEAIIPDPLEAVPLQNASDHTQDISLASPSFPNPSHSYLRPKLHSQTSSRPSTFALSEPSPNERSSVAFHDSVSDNRQSSTDPSG